jgi:hypothetical protein
LVNLEFSEATKTAAMTKTQAFNHLITDDNIETRDFGDWGYAVFSDHTNDKTYISVAYGEDVRRIPIDGDYAGGYITLRLPYGRDKRSLKILEHYNRGTEIYQNYFTSYGRDNIPTKRVEFVLEGALPKEYQPFGADRSYLSDDETFHIDRGNGWEGVNWFYTSMLSPSNGRTSELKLASFSSLGCRVYAAREDGIFNSTDYGLAVAASTADVTFLILDFEDVDDVPDFVKVGDDSLVGYSIGDERQGNQYEIFASKDLPATSAYYVDIFTGSSGARLETRKQYACRIQSSTVSFGERDDVFDLWHRFNFHELHNVVLQNRIYDTAIDTDETKKIHYSQMVYVEVNDFPLTPSAPAAMKCPALWIGFDKGLLHEDAGATGVWEDSWPFSVVHTAKEDFVGKFIMINQGYISLI